MMAGLKKILLILDIDETLIHATAEKPPFEPDFAAGPFFVKKRPFLDQFLRSCDQWFTLMVYSSGTENYVDQIVKEITPPGVTFYKIWNRNNCTYHYLPDQDIYLYIKQLKKLKQTGYPLEHMIVVDDNPWAHTKHYGNSVIVRPFEGDPGDQELLLLEKYLYTLKDCEDVRKVEKRNWRRGFGEASGPADLKG